MSDDAKPRPVSREQAEEAQRIHASQMCGQTMVKCNRDLRRWQRTVKCE